MRLIDQDLLTEATELLKVRLESVSREAKIFSLELGMAIPWMKDLEHHVPLAELPGCEKSKGIIRWGQHEGKEFIVLEQGERFSRFMDLHLSCSPYWALANLGFESFLFFGSGGALFEGAKETDCVVLTDLHNYTGIDPFMGQDESFIKRWDRREAYSQSLVSDFLNNADSCSLRVSLANGCLINGPLLPNPIENERFREHADIYLQSNGLESMLLHGLGKSVLSLSLVSHLAMSHRGGAIVRKDFDEAVAYGMRQVSLVLLNMGKEGMIV